MRQKQVIYWPNVMTRRRRMNYTRMIVVINFGRTKKILVSFKVLAQCNIMEDENQE
jgi:hypothetical protein